MIKADLVHKIGDIILKYSGNKFIWHACIKCGKERWVQLLRGLPRSPHCNKCVMTKQMYKWKGGRTVTAQGYVGIKLFPDDFFYSMARNHGYVLEHRLVMAKYFNRCLLSWEIVHHKNGIKDDNRIENLELISCKGKHNTEINKHIKNLEREVATLKKRVTLLESENVLLRTGHGSVIGGMHYDTK